MCAKAMYDRSTPVQSWRADPSPKFSEQDVPAAWVWTPHTTTGAVVRASRLGISSVSAHAVDAVAAIAIAAMASVAFLSRLLKIREIIITLSLRLLNPSAQRPPGHRTTANRSSTASVAGLSDRRTISVLDDSNFHTVI